jgi:hypothetical protein
VTERAALTAPIEQLHTERGGITESRSVAVIEAELQRAPPGAATVWRATAGCPASMTSNTLSPKARRSFFGIDRANAAHHARAKVFLDALGRSGGRGLEGTGP